MNAAITSPINITITSPINTATTKIMQQHTQIIIVHITSPINATITSPMNITITSPMNAAMQNTIIPIVTLVLIIKAIQIEVVQQVIAQNTNGVTMKPSHEIKIAERIVGAPHNTARIASTMNMTAPIPPIITVHIIINGANNIHPITGNIVSAPKGRAPISQMLTTKLSHTDHSPAMIVVKN